MASVVDPPLVGRDRPVRDIGVLVDAASTGRGGLLLVSGEAGIGKTRVAEETMDLGVGSGMATAWATCRAGAGAPPFWPWTEALAQLVAGPLPFDDVRPSSDPDVARFQLFAAAERLLRERSGEGPLLIVLDDAHWADYPSLTLLAFLAPALLVLPVLVVATFRPDEPGAALNRALPELLRHAQHIVLGGLGTDDLHALVVALTGDEPTDASVAELARLTLGNPLFAREYLRLADQGRPLSAVLADGEVPSGIRAVLDRHLTGVGDPTVLHVTAVIGMEVTADLVEEVVGEPVRDRLAEASDLGLLRPLGSDRWAFTHPLVRAAAYDGIGASRRAALHLAVGTALESRDGGAGELAHHFAAGNDAGRAAGHAERAAGEAMALLAPEQAVAWFTVALDGAGEDRQVDLLLARGEAQVAVGDLDAAQADYLAAAERARRDGSPEQLARAALGLGSGASGFEIPTSDRTLRRLLDEALSTLPAEPSATRVRLLARLSVALPFAETPAEERRRVAEQALAMARTVGDASALAAALAAHGDAIGGPEHTEARLAEATEVVALAQQLDDVPLELLGRRFRIVALLERGDRAGAEAESRGYAATADAIRQPLYSWYGPLWRGSLALADGRWDDAAACCAEAEELGRSAGSENALMLTLTLRWAFLYFVGANDELLDEVVRLFDEWPDYSTMMRAIEADSAALAGRADLAGVALDRIPIDGFAAGIYGAEVLGTAWHAANAVWLLGGHPLGAALYEYLQPHRDRMVIDGIGAAVLGSVEHCLGQLAAVDGRADDAAVHFAAAEAAHRRFGSAPLVAMTVAHAGHHAATNGLRLVREGDVWAASYDGRTVRVTHTKGMADLGHLVAVPGHEVHVLDLMAEGAGAVVERDVGPVLDDTARAAYRSRLTEIEAELDRADGAGDVAASGRLTDERAALVAQLAGATGLGGRPRRVGGSSEKARSAVTQRLRAAIARLEGEDPALGAHLRESVVTGTYCSYTP